MRFILVEIRIDDTEAAIAIVEVLLKYEIIHGFQKNETGRYEIHVDSFQSIPKSLHPYIRSTAYQKADQLIQQILYEYIGSKEEKELIKDVYLV